MNTLAYMTPEEVLERERALDVFLASVSAAEMSGSSYIIVQIKDAAEVRNELERLSEIEDQYDSSQSNDE